MRPITWFAHTLALLALATASTASQSDAFKCRQPNGKFVFSNTVCDETASLISTQRSDHISAEQQQNAINDVRRQRQYLNTVERERQTSSQYVSTANSHQGTGNVYDPDTRDRIHACLMKVTALFGLSPYDEGRRKVDCYRGTKGLLDECEGRITATARLTTQQEQSLRGLCRSVTGG
jgi:hypothetical protein